MIKLFISQPMNGLSDEDVLKERDRAIKCAKKQFGEDIEVLDSYFTEDEPEGVNSGLWWLGKSIELLAQAAVRLSMVNFTKDMTLRKEINHRQELSRVVNPILLRDIVRIGLR